MPTRGGRARCMLAHYDRCLAPSSAATAATRAAGKDSGGAAAEPGGLGNGGGGGGLCDVVVGLVKMF